MTMNCSKCHEPTPYCYGCRSPGDFASVKCSINEPVCIVCFEQVHDGSRL